MEEDETDSEVTDFEEEDEGRAMPIEEIVGAMYGSWTSDNDDMEVDDSPESMSESPIESESISVSIDSMPETSDDPTESNDSVPISVSSSSPQGFRRGPMRLNPEDSESPVTAPTDQGEPLNRGEADSGTLQSRIRAVIQRAQAELTSSLVVPDPQPEANNGTGVTVEAPPAAAPNVVDLVTPPANVRQEAVAAVASSHSVSSPSPKSRKRAADDSNSDPNDFGNDDGMSCSICLDLYTNSGEHRIVSIKCGHLFGRSCIERWLKVGCVGAIKRCPQCNTKANLKDIRIVYARRLTAMDTAENDRLKQELEKVYSDCKRLELELVKSKMSNEMLEKQFLEQQKEMKAKFMSGTGSGNPGCIHCNRSQTTSPRLVYTHKLSNGGGRVLAHNKYLSLLIASQASTNPVFQGYGVAKINSLDFNVSEFMYLHPKVIRDLAFHPHEPNVLLSVSLDKTAKLVDVSCNTVVQTYQVESPVWSCCWDTQNSNICFIGTQTGSILQFDRRRTDKVVLEFPGDRTPIVSLSSVPAVPGRMISKGGIIACRLSSVWAFERDQMEGYHHRRLPLEGTFISLNFDTELDLILASARPSQNHPSTRHMVYQLTPSDDPSLCQHIHTFYGGSTVGNLSKSRLLHANNETLVCAFNESSKTIDAYHLSSFSKKFSLSSKDKESVTDLIPVNVNKSMYLSTLSENCLNVYSIPSK